MFMPWHCVNTSKKVVFSEFCLVKNDKCVVVLLGSEIIVCVSTSILLCHICNQAISKSRLNEID